MGCQPSGDHALQSAPATPISQFRIGSVRRQGPLVDIATPGQVQVGVRSRVTLSTSEARFAQGRADIVEPTTGELRALVTDA